MTSRPLRVFLCHSSNDKPAVRELYQKLRAEPWIQPWLDEEELYPGQDWDLEIQKAIKETDAIIVCISKSSTTKEGYVQKEIKKALDYSDKQPEGAVFIIPVRLEECQPPERLSKWQYADYFEGQRERGSQRLLVSLQKRAETLGFMMKEAASQPDSFYEKAVKHKEFVEWIDKLVNESSKKPGSGDLNLNKITLSNGMEFMRVPAGKFLMGSDKHNENEKSQHTVDIPYDYWMARYLVTNESYNAFLEVKEVEHPVMGWEALTEHPVVNINLDDTIAYCRWLTRLCEAELLSGFVLRLPTEAEWEKAARGIDGRGYPWGNQFDDGKCNTGEKSVGSTTPVGMYSPHGDSPYGCADMAGNVWEWTCSLYEPYPFNIKNINENTSNTHWRSLRGGSWRNLQALARVSVRRNERPYQKWDNFGFRVCIAPPIPK